ncbi:PIR protein [Plasmodium yoelii]|uniref:PIR protein n=2 Tax=Plasmodium yoelii TaxID=5861 RepID=A0AAF0B4L0_PLAYO|nr:PIR protein [Plasmodium yoelii]WBY59563.1 PIR protein [Plasmodium yoelii yoelii]VTZ80305.1 PIR protein [Plasmodium yoelii]|eukprot:XP_022812767.1 PIR protein [Plasmodium yoelii]
MNAEICKNFLLVREKFPDQLDNNENYTFKDKDHFKDYCTSGCDGSLEKVNAGCLYFFNEFFGSSELFQSVANSNINIVEYIMIWLSYMLNLKNNEPNITNLEHFYKTYIDGSDQYKKPIANVKKYTNYKDLIDTKKYYLKMDKNITSKLYNAFKLLCEMYTIFNGNTSNCEKCSEKANQFVNKYQELNNPNNIKDIAYCQALSTLSNDYNNLKNKCKNYKLLPEINTTQNNVKCFEDTSSSSSISKNIFLVLSIFGAIGIFLGISYKYSLFGFRKRFQKQKLREKLKNIKKRMNH